MDREQVGKIMILVSIIILLIDAGIGIYGRYQYSKQFGSYWNLAEKASTIVQKTEYIDKFIQALEESNLKGKYNVLFLDTPDNSFDKNLEALKSLQKRLHEIQTMDITSFQYQTAIQQITSQEQGEAKAMLDVFYEIWWKENHILLWNWIGCVNVIGCVVGFMLGVILLGV